jgi:hypothetical protein
MKTLSAEGFFFYSDGESVSVADPLGNVVAVPYRLLARAVAELNRPPTPAVRADASSTPPNVATDAPAAEWVPLSVDRLYHGTPCCYRTGVSRDGAVTWTPWDESSLVVSVREYDVPRSHRFQTQFWQRGAPESISIAGRRDIPEYPPDELSDGVLSADGGDCLYLLEVKVPA